MTITVDGFREVLDILKGLFNGLKSAAGLPEANRKEMRAALADTAELIDQTLTILKKHLATVLSELKFGDEAAARKMVYELGDFPGWEEKYREFQMCDTLRASLDNMQRSGIFNVKNNIGLADAQVIHQRMCDYIGGETNAAHSVGTMLMQLSALSDTAKYTRDDVVTVLENAKNTILEWRQKFIDLEQQIRSAI